MICWEKGPEGEKVPQEDGERRERVGTESIPPIFVTTELE
jgi:hypothetical protein